MIYLFTGIMSWSLVHLLTVTKHDLRAKIIAKIGTIGYRLLFSIIVIGSLALIVYGWRQDEGLEIYYDIYSYGIVPALVLMIFACVLVATSFVKSNFNRKFRRPLLSGFSIWAIAHLLMNGDGRSLLLFAGMLVWSQLMIAFLNRRDGVWVNDQKYLPHQGAKVFCIGLLIFIGLVFLHPYITGIDLQTLPH